jgi:hypothetical protein
MSYQTNNASFPSLPQPAPDDLLGSPPMPGAGPAFVPQT